MVNYNFSNLHLKKCKWSKDSKKRYKQIKHFRDNCNSYDINISDLIKLTEMGKDCFKRK